MLKKIVKKLAGVFDPLKHFDPETNNFKIWPERKTEEVSGAPKKSPIVNN